MADGCARFGGEDTSDGLGPLVSEDKANAGAMQLRDDSVRMVVKG